MKPIADVNPTANYSRNNSERRFVDGSTGSERDAQIGQLLADDDLKYLVCPDCHGTRVHCDTCGGYGLVCPDCCGARFVAAAKPDEDPTRYYPHAVTRCPTCNPNGHYDKGLEALAIKRALERRAPAPGTSERIQKMRLQAVRT